MRNLIALALLVSCLVCGSHCQAQERAVLSEELMRNPRQYSGKKLIFEGEAIGDIMKRGNYSWVNLNDGKNAIGIWIDGVQASGIKTLGSYSAQGDILRVTGVFNEICMQHGGDMDIHAESVEVLRPGQIHDEIFSVYKISAAFSLAAVLGLLWILNRLKNR